MAQQHGVGDLLGAGRIADALLGDDADVPIVVLDGGLEGVVALVGDVVGGVMEDPADRAGAAHGLGERVRGLLAHLEQVVGDDRGVVDAVHVAVRQVGQEHQLHAVGDRCPERLGRGHRIERQREDDAGLLDQRGLDVAALLGGVERGVGGGDHLDSQPGELVGRARRDGVREVRQVVPQQRSGMAAALELRGAVVGDGHGLRRGRRFPLRADGLRHGRQRGRQGRGGKGRKPSNQVLIRGHVMVLLRSSLRMCRAVGGPVGEAGFRCTRLVLLRSG